MSGEAGDEVSLMAVATEAEQHDAVRWACHVSKEKPRFVQRLTGAGWGISGQVRVTSA
jgi:hypothetical protein